MQEPIFTSKVQHLNRFMLSALLVSLGMACVVIFLVVVIVDWDNLDHVLERYNLFYFLIAAAALTAPGVYLAVTKGAILQIYEQRKGLSISVLQKDRLFVHIEPGFTTEGVWFLVEHRRGLKVRNVYLTFFEHGNPVLTINLRMVYNPDFRLIDPLKINFETGEGRAKLSKKQDRFSCKKLIEIDQLLRKYQENQP